VRSVDVEIHFDPGLAEVTGATRAAGLPGDWVLGPPNIAPGVLKLSLFGTTALSGTNVVLINIDATVPVDAPYGSTQVVRLVNLRVNEGNLAAVADRAVHHAAFVGDTDGNRNYTAIDSFLIARVTTLQDTGFDFHHRVDPVIVADATGDGTLSAFDASLVARTARRRCWTSR